MAYEMRISDWSSDVCSSELQETQLGRLVTCVDRYGHRARHDDAEQQLDEFRPRGQQNAHIVARLDAERDERSRPGACRLVELAIADLAIRKNQRGRIGMARGRDRKSTRLNSSH